MKKEDVKKVLAAMLGNVRECRIEEAITLLQAELDRPEPEPVMSIEIWTDGTSGYPQYDLSIQNEALVSLGEGRHPLYKDAP